MGDNSNNINGNEQRQYSGGGGNGPSGSNAVSRKKANNGGAGGDLCASPKYNKGNARGSNRDGQQQKQYRGNNNRGQRGGGHSRSRHYEQGNPPRDEKNDGIDPAGLDDDDDLHVVSNEVFELDDQYAVKGGSGYAKKTNMSHLLNFHYLDKQRVNIRGNRRSGNMSSYSRGRGFAGGYSTYRQSFSKDQFLQANCQFVVQKGSIDYSLHFADPDLAIDWARVEQVRLHSMQPLKCPICLSEPQAGKITRCGHVYCWSCLLHYLALSDKPWRKCPVCSESIYKHDIRSVRGIISRCVRPGDWIRFRLMCRERGSVIFYPRAVFDELIGQAEPEGLFMEVDKQPYAHLLSASENVILNEIIEREKLELLKQLEEDGDQPEACFIRQALEENNERDKLVRERMGKPSSDRDVKLTLKQQPEEAEARLLPIQPPISYDNAFENIIRTTPPEEFEKLIDEKSDSNEYSSTDKVPSRPMAAASAQPNRHYFYQADEIYHAYLNGFNTRILLHEHGSYQDCPDELHVRVEAIESHFMTEDLRSQYRALNHLPLTCEFQVIEIRLHPPMISPATMQAFTDEIHRRRQLRTRKERLEKRRQEQAEFAESQKLFSQYPPEMMYIPHESFPVNGTSSMEEFPAIISSATSSSPPSASIQLSDENLSPPASVSFAQMLKQQAPLVSKSADRTTIAQRLANDVVTKNKKKKAGNDSDEEPNHEDDEYYASASNFRSSFSLQSVFDRLKLVNGDEHPVTSDNQDTGNATTTTTTTAATKKKNKRNKQVLFATGLGGQTKL